MDAISPPFKTAIDEAWINLNWLGKVKITSEDPENPIEDAFIPGIETGWSARQSGRQTLEVHFYEPLTLKRIRLVFNENHFTRTQEFVLRWSKDGLNFHEIVRQQYNFRPRTTEIEEFEVKLEDAKALQLTIIPEIAGGAVIATLAEFRVA